MARSTEEIFEIMRGKAIADATTAGRADAVAMLNNNSGVAVWRMLFYTIAFIIHTTEVVYDTLVERVLGIIAELVPHTLRWYRRKVLNFQFGFPLLPDSDKFNNGTASSDDIAASKVVKYCAVNEATVNQVRVLLVKVAGQQNGRPAPLLNTQQQALEAYISEVKDAGNTVLLYNRQADVIKAALNVFYNPLLLDGLGNRLDGGAGKPIEDAANAFAFNLDFNGEFIVSQFVDFVQNAYGVSRRRVDLLQFQKRTGTNAFQNVSSSFIPDAGYAVFDTNGLTINYIPDVVN